MAITVRVQNFQSIEDATVILDGFTVVTGQNNSGKTALMRAIRGVFTNPPPGALVRHGCSQLTVTLSFDDGNSVVWEKGAKINRYTVNGKVLDNVGRGVPAEVEALGVRPISAGTDKLWPQIADQFSGVLFLVGSPGSVIAEAVADVERVGRLSSALKLAESDRRSASTTLKVRRKDQDALDDELQTFKGLDDVSRDVSNLTARLSTAEMQHRDLQSLLELRSRYRTTQGAIAFLLGVHSIYIPEKERVTQVRSLRQAFAEAVRFQDRLSEQRRVVSRLDKVRFVPPMASGAEAGQVRDSLRQIRDFRSRMQRSRTTLHHLAPVAHVVVPVVNPKIKSTQEALVYVRTLQKRHTEARKLVASLEAEALQVQAQLENVLQVVSSLIDTLGVCPTCRRPAHSGENCT